MKIDVEGFEFKVLTGMKDLLTKASLAQVMLEFNSMNVCSRSFLIDFVRLLPEFRLFRILPGGRVIPVEVDDTLFSEIFAYQNLVFCRPVE